jgi:hypothetical protein
MGQSSCRFIRGYWQPSDDDDDNTSQFTRTAEYWRGEMRKIYRRKGGYQNIGQENLIILEGGHQNIV